MVESKDIIEAKFEELKKKIITKNDDFVKKIEEELNKLSAKFSKCFSR